MADNITLNAGSGGAICAADDVSGVLYQRIKLTPGGDGQAAYACTGAKYICTGAANQDANAFKSGAGVLYSVIAVNNASAARYLKFYDATAPTSASTPYHTIPLAANQGGVALTFPLGIVHATGIAMRATTGQADNDANAVTSGDVVVNVTYV